MDIKLKKAIITLSFDDGRRDTFDVFMNILKPMNIPATINIPTGYIEMGFFDPNDIGYNGLMTKRQLDEISECSLFEIAGHGHMHNNSDEDVTTSIVKLKAWYPQYEKGIGFASPHSEINYNTFIRKKETYKNLGISYVRSGRNISRKRYIKRAFVKLSKIIKSPLLFVICYKGSLNNGITRGYLHAVPIMRENSLEQIIAIIKYAEKKRKWVVFEFHGIDTVTSVEYREEFCWDINKFIALVNFLKSEQSIGNLMVHNALSLFTNVCKQ